MNGKRNMMNEVIFSDFQFFFHYAFVVVWLAKGTGFQFWLSCRSSSTLKSKAEESNWSLTDNLDSKFSVQGFCLQFSKVCL